MQGARRAERCMAIPLGGKPPSGWSSETYHEDRRAFEHRATQQFARAVNKSAPSLGKKDRLSRWRSRSVSSRRSLPCWRSIATDREQVSNSSSAVLRQQGQAIKKRQWLALCAGDCLLIICCCGLPGPCRTTAGLPGGRLFRRGRRFHKSHRGVPWLVRCRLQRLFCTSAAS